MKEPWKGRIAPFRIADNLYFVGTKPASSHIIDTGNGLIMLDSGYPQTLYLVIESIHELGFSPKDIKYIIHSHGHYDHLGGTKGLIELAGARTFIGEADVPLANGTQDLTWARELGHEYWEAFEPDVALKDGDIIELGNTCIEVVSTPGHTKGTMSYFFNVQYDGKTLLAGTHGGTGLNTLSRNWLIKNKQPFSCRDEFREGLLKVRDRQVDIFIGNHADQNHTVEKSKQLVTATSNPFINPSEWHSFIDHTLASLDALIHNEPHSQDYKRN